MTNHARAPWHCNAVLHVPASCRTFGFALRVGQSGLPRSPPPTCLAPIDDLTSQSQVGGESVEAARESGNAASRSIHVLIAIFSLRPRRSQTSGRTFTGHHSGLSNTPPRLLRASRSAHRGRPVTGDAVGRWFRPTRPERWLVLYPAVQLGHDHSRPSPTSTTTANPTTGGAAGPPRNVHDTFLEEIDASSTFRAASSYASCST